MITIKSYLGVALIVVGALLLSIGYLAGWTSSNLLLLGGLFMVILGAVMHVRQQKKSAKY